MSRRRIVVQVGLWIAAAGGAAAAAGAGSKAPGSGASREVAHVSPGMSVDQAKAGLKKHKPPFLTVAASAPQPLSDLPGATYVPYVTANVSKSGSMPYPMTNAAIFFSPPPLPSRAVSIGVTEFYGDKDASTVENVKAALAEKYGASSWEESSPAAPGGPIEGTLRWAWTPDDKPMTKEAARPCLAVIGMGLGSLGHLSEVQNALKQLQPLACGTIVEATYKSAGGIVSRVQIALLDINHLRSALEKTLLAMKEASSHGAQRAADKAKANKPNL